MITQNEIRKKTENLYLEFLKSIVTEEAFFPKVIRSDKSVDLDKERQKLAEVIEHSKDRKGFGYEIVYKKTNTRKHGIQSSLEEISFQTELDFLKYLHKEKEVAEFRENCSLIISKFHELKEWIIKCPSKIIDNHSQWNDLLEVCQYFKDNSKPNLYIRELPIKVHTKFIGNNKGIIKELLDILIKDHIIDNEETNFEKRFNLKSPPSLVRFRILDKNISQKYFSGMNDMSVPVSQFEQLKLPLKNVLVVENKTNLLTIALTLSELEETIVVFGSGYKVENLKKVEWLKQMRLFYWGDLDAQGFEILSQFRGYFPNVKSLFMDNDTFNKFFENDSGTQSKITTELNLTDEERQLYLLLKENNWRLEQEKIRIEYVKEFLEKSLIN